MITAVMSVFVALLGTPLAGWILQLLIQNQGTILIPAILATSIAETASAVAVQMLAPVIIEGIIFMIVGLGMVIVALLLAKRDQIIKVTY